MYRKFTQIKGTPCFIKVCKITVRVQVFGWIERRN